MFFVEWRGYGLLGFVPLPFGLIALGALADADYTFSAAALAAGLTYVLAGAGLWLAARHLRKPTQPDDLYYIPLWFWGVLYIVLGLVIAAWTGLDVSRHGWRK